LATPVVIGTQAAGTFADATGHSGQSHLFYAQNADVWWLLTLTSSADSQGGSNHVVKAYVSSGPDLATATWTAAASSPGATGAQSANCSNCYMGGGRALGVAYVNNAPTDAVHAEIAMAYDGQNGLTAHIRATVTATSIQWSTWNYYDAPAATWALPRAVSLGVSTGKFIHSGGPTLQQQVDANARLSLNADTGASWTNGFSAVSLIDNSMSHQSNAMIFAALASNRMLAVYDNGGGQAPCYQCENGVPEPNLSNLGYKRSNTNGSWPTLPAGGQAAGDGKVFAADATINQNDWTMVARDTTTIQVFRRNGAGTGIDAAAYDAATNTWAAFPAPPLFGPGQSHKAGSGVFGISANSEIVLFVISNDSANSILYTIHDGTAWSAWAPVPGTDTGTHVRNFLSGARVAAADQIGLIWTEGPSPYNVVTTSLGLAPTVPDVVNLSQAAATARITAAGMVVGTVTTASSTTVTAGSVISQNPAAGTPASAGSAVDLVIALAVVPNLVNLPQASAATALTNAGLLLGVVETEPHVTVPVGSVISQSPPALAEVPVGTSIDLVVSSGVTVPNVVGQSQAEAITTIQNVAGLGVGLITTAPSDTVAAGLVISQDPAGDTNVSGGRSIDLVVSAGRPIVPGVVGLTQAAAIAAITAAQLTVGSITSEVSETVPAGTVIGQNPAAGASAALNSAVDLVISSGAAPTPVPDVVNMTQAAATDAITSAGLIVGIVTNAASATVPTGSVISQTPSGGTLAPPGSAVNLVVSTGPAPVPVPNVVDMTQAAATSAITGATLVVGIVTNASSVTVPAGSVISQSPVGGSLAPPGSAVNLVISTGPSTTSPIVDKVVFSDGKSTRTTPQFSTSAPNELLLAFVSSDGPTSGGQTVRVTGAGLTWTLVRRANIRLGTSEVWQAHAIAQLTNVTVRSRQSWRGYRQSLTVVTFRNASGVGASAIASGATGAPSVTLITPAANSLVYGVGNDWDRAVARTLGSDQVMVHQWVATVVGDTFWVQRWNAVVPSAGTSIRLNCTAPTNDQWNFVGVAVVP
jgi:beta-lactam-binding protein with PASTA domain